MKKPFNQPISWLLQVVVLLLAASPVSARPVDNINANQAYDLLRADPSVFLLDVRTPGEYLQLRLDDSHLIPIDSLLQRLDELPGDRPILVYCAVGSRSSQVAGYLAKQGYPRVYNLIGGIWAWQLRGYPVLQGPP